MGFAKRIEIGRVIGKLVRTGLVMGSRTGSVGGTLTRNGSIMGNDNTKGNCICIRIGIGTWSGTGLGPRTGSETGTGHRNRTRNTIGHGKRLSNSKYNRHPYRKG